MPRIMKKINATCHNKVSWQSKATRHVVCTLTPFSPKFRHAPQKRIALTRDTTIFLYADSLQSQYV